MACRQATLMASLMVSLVAGCSSSFEDRDVGRDLQASAPANATAARPALDRNATTPAPPPVSLVPLVPLGAPTAVHNWGEVRMQAALRLMAANPSITYREAVPDVLLAIPVLEVELNADGTIRRITVLRRPRQAADTVQIAIDALYRAAPFGDVSRLARPWKFVQTFLFNDERKFKPRLLDI